VPCSRATKGRKRAASTRQVVLVCGPPCSGKSTYVQQNAKPGDLIVDFDAIAQALGSVRTHNHDVHYRPKAQALVDDLIQQVADGQHQRAWVIRSLPKTRARRALAKQLGAKVVVIDAPDAELIARAKARPDPDRTIEAIRYWRSAASG
jgi:5-methylcytosine-specific restriction protein A